MGRETENTLLGALLPSAMPTEYAKLAIAFPDLQGKTVLEIGGGQSAVSAWLRTQGANVYTLDPRYSDLSKLDRAMEQAIPGIKKNFRNADELGKWDKYKADLNQARTEWRQDIESNPSHYIAGYATALPVPAGSIDFLFSINCLTHGLDRHEDIFTDAVKEIYRVLKPGSEAQLYPFLWTKDKKIERLHGELLSGIGTQLQGTSGSYRVRMRKPTFLK